MDKITGRWKWKDRKILLMNFLHSEQRTANERVRKRFRFCDVLMIYDRYLESNVQTHAAVACIAWHIQLWYRSSWNHINKMNFPLTPTFVAKSINWHYWLPVFLYSSLMKNVRYKPSWRCLYIVNHLP